MNREQTKKNIERAEELLNGAELQTKFAQQHLKEAKAQLATMEETYSIGDRFKYKGISEKYLLAKIDCAIAGLIHLRHGTRWNEGRKVGDLCKITQEEMQRIYSTEKFTRYWDSQKKLYVNGYTKENH